MQKAKFFLKKHLNDFLLGIVILGGIYFIIHYLAWLGVIGYIVDNIIGLLIASTIGALAMMLTISICCISSSADRIYCDNLLVDMQKKVDEKDKENAELEKKLEIKNEVLELNNKLIKRLINENMKQLELIKKMRDSGKSINPEGRIV